MPATSSLLESSVRSDTLQYHRGMSTGDEPRRCCACGVVDRAEEQNPHAPCRRCSSVSWASVGSEREYYQWWARPDVCRVGSHRLDEEVRELTLIPRDPATTTGVESVLVRCCADHEADLDAWISREWPGLVRAPDHYRRPSPIPLCAKLWPMGRHPEVVVDGMGGEAFPLPLDARERIGSGSACEIRLTAASSSTSTPSLVCFVNLADPSCGFLESVAKRAVLVNGELVDAERIDLHHGDVIGIVGADGRVVLLLGYARELTNGGPMPLPAPVPPARDFFTYREPYLLPASEGRERELVVDAAGSAHVVEHTRDEDGEFHPSAGRVVATSKLNDTMVRGPRDVVTRPIFAPLSEAPEGAEAPLVVLFERPLPRVVLHDRQGPAYGDAGPAWMFETLVRRILFDMKSALGG